MEPSYKARVNESGAGSLMQVSALCRVLPRLQGTTREAYPP